MKRLLCLTLCTLLTLLPCAALCGCDEEPVTACAVTGVVYDPDKARLEVSCALTKDALDAKASRLCLFALPPELQIDSVDLSSLTPVAEAYPRAHVTFNVPVGEGETDSLFAAYLPVLYDRGTGTYTPVCLPKSLDSASSAIPAARTRSVKGLAVGADTDYDADALKLGVSSVILPVRLDRLVPADWEEGAVPYLWNGTTRYLRGTELDALDSRIGFFTRAGTRVYLRLTLGYDGAMPAPACLYCPGVTPREGGSYAVNTGSPEAVDLLEGLITGLVCRFAPDDSPVGRGLCRDFIMGEAVNDPARWESGADSEKTAAAYAALLRITDTALSLYAPQGGVFADFLVTDGEEPAATGYQDFLLAFAGAVQSRGDFNWNLSARIEAGTTRVWSDEPRLVRDALHYQPNLLRVTRIAMSASDSVNVNLAFTPQDNPRRIALTLTVPGDDEAGQAASYAFAYMSAAVRDDAEALFWGDHVSARSTALRALRPDGGTGTREVYAMLGVMDTNRAESRLSVARQIIGTDYKDVELRTGGYTPPVTRTDTAASAVEKLPRGASPVISFTDGTIPFADGGLLSHCGLTRVDDTVMLNAAFRPARSGMPAGITTVLEPGALDGVRSLYLPMRVYPDNDTRVTVTVTITRPAGASGGCLLYTAAQTGVTSGTPFIFSCDVADFAESVDQKDACVLSVTVEPESDNPAACRLLLESVSAAGAAHGLSTGALVGIWVGVGVLLVVGLSVLLYVRSKKKKESY